MEVIIYNINYNPETITDLEKLLRKIKVSHTTEYLSSFPKLLSKNTELLVNLEIPMSGTPAQILTEMPIVIAEKIIELKLSKSQIRAYVNIMNKQLSSIYKELKEGDNRKYVIYRDYMDNIRRATAMLSKCCGVVKENIAEMQPDIIPYEDGVIEDVVAELEDAISDIVFDEGDEFDESVIESFILIESKANQLASLIIEEDSKTATGISKAANAIGTSGRKVLHKARKMVGNVRRIDTAVNKVTDPFVNAINNTLDSIKKKDSDERRNRIITGQYRFKLSNFLRKGIITLAAGKLVANAVTGAALVNPLLAIIGTLASWAIDKRLDEKERKKILEDLEGELKIVNEKIDDSKSDNQRKEKYELMRIKQRLEKDIERIKYRLDEN
jgi:hypothetical protein